VGLCLASEIETAFIFNGANKLTWMELSVITHMARRMVENKQFLMTCAL